MYVCFIDEQRLILLAVVVDIIGVKSTEIDLCLDHLPRYYPRGQQSTTMLIVRNVDPHAGQENI